MFFEFYKSRTKALDGEKREDKHRDTIIKISKVGRMKVLVARVCNEGGQHRSIDNGETLI